MKLIDKIKFLFKYDIEFEFMVFDFKGQSMWKFLTYNDAQEFSLKQIEYKPKVLVEIRKKK